MRLVLVILGIPILLVGLAVLLLPVLLDEEALLEIAAEAIKEETGAVLRVEGETSLSLFPKVELASTEVGIEMPDSNTRITARSFAAGVALFPLFRRSVEIDRITVDGLTIASEAEDEAAARAAAMDTSSLSDAELDVFYAAREKTRRILKDEASAAALSAPLALEIGELSLTDIHLITVDANGAPISELELRHLTASDLNNKGRAIPLSAEVYIPSTGDEAPREVALRGAFSNDAQTGTAALDKLSIRVSGVTTEPLDISASGTFDLDERVADLKIELRSGELEGSGDLRYAAYDSPQIDARLALTELDPALLFLAGPEAAGAAADSAGASGDDVPLPLHALRMIDTRAQLSIDAVVLKGHRLEGVAASLRVRDGVATLQPVTAAVHGGALDFSAVFNGRYNRATLSTAGEVADLDIGRAVTASELDLDASGRARLEWDLNARGSSSSALTRSLTGPIDFTTEDITLRGIAMQRMLCRGVALVNQETLSAEFPGDTSFEALSAKIQLADGVARLDPLIAQLPAVALGGTGTLDLSSQDLRASFRARLSPELGEFDPACEINERYTELRWPVECKGNLAGDPGDWCSVNTAEIIKDLAEGEVKRKINEQAGKLFNKLFERD